MSPIAPEALFRTVSTVKIETLVADYQQKFGIDIRYLIPRGIEEIELRECLTSGLHFYYPENIIGDGEFYSKLEQFDWYYKEKRWEFDRSIQISQDLKVGKVLEVGCGSGKFLDQISAALKHAEVCGLELNENAAEKARKRGHNVKSSLSEVTVKNGFYKGFDAIYMFQVFEHVARPVDLLEECNSALAPGGYIFIAVPDNSPREGGFRSWNPNALLNFPPHHQARWCTKSLFYLAQKMDLHVHSLLFEPAIAPEYKATYRYEVKLKILRTIPFFGVFVYALLRPVINFVINVVCKYMPAHSVLIVLKKPQ